jgi:hypothetical protein
MTSERHCLTTSTLDVQVGCNDFHADSLGISCALQPLHKSAHSRPIARLWRLQTKYPLSVMLHDGFFDQRAAEATNSSGWSAS